MIATPWAPLIEVVALRYGLDADLLTAQMMVESSGQPDAFRFEPGYYRRYIRGNPAALARAYGPLAACSYGLLQILYESAVEIGFSGQPHELFDPSTGLEWGARYLADLLRWAGGDYTRALCAFNGGKVGNSTPPYRNQTYADKVLGVKDDTRRT